MQGPKYVVPLLGGRTIKEDGKMGFIITREGTDDNIAPHINAEFISELGFWTVYLESLEELVDLRNEDGSEVLVLDYSERHQMPMIRIREA